MALLHDHKATSRREVGAPRGGFSSHNGADRIRTAGGFGFMAMAAAGVLANLTKIAPAETAALIAAVAGMTLGAIFSRSRS